MASKCPMIRAAVIAREAKKMQLEAHKEQLKILQEEYKLLVQAVKDEKERFKSGKASAGPRVYKDNAANRKLGRVGKPIPSKKKVKKETDSSASVSPAVTGGGASDGAAKEAKATTQRVYKDNAANRKLGRVGKPIPSRKGKKNKKTAKHVEIEEAVVEEIPEAVSKAAEPEEVEENGDELNSVTSDSDSDSDSSSDDEGF